jgi:hypothetical protein
MKPKNIDRNVEETLESLEGIQRAAASPFLFTRIEARLKETTARVPRSWAWGFTSALLVIAALNLWTNLRFRENRNMQVPQAEQYLCTTLSY